jgi:hypothetical protein
VIVTNRRSRSGTGHPGRHDAVIRAAFAASIVLTALAKPAGSTGANVVVVGAAGGRVRTVEGVEEVADVEGAG